jgi:hypothetical protein
MWHQRAGSNDLMSLGGEEVEELLADFRAFHKLGSLCGVECETLDFK